MTTILKSCLLLLLCALPSFGQLIEPASSGSRQSKNLRQIKNHLLQTTISVNWEGRTLLEALGEIRAVSGLNFHVGRGLGELREEELDLTLVDVPIYMVMRILSDEFDIGFLQRGKILIAMSRTQMMRRSFKLGVYDIRAGLYVPPDFPGPSLNLKVSGTEPEAPDLPERETPDPERVVEIIKGVTGESNWEIEGASIEIHRGRLIMRHSPGMQRRVLKILAGLGML